jgi:hypothetical protein
MLQPLRPEDFSLTTEQSFELVKVKMQLAEKPVEELRTMLASAAEQLMVYQNIIKAMTRKNAEVEFIFNPNKQEG